MNGRLTWVEPMLCLLSVPLVPGNASTSQAPLLVRCKMSVRAVHLYCSRQQCVCVHRLMWDRQQRLQQTKQLTLHHQTTPSSAQQAKDASKATSDSTKDAAPSGNPLTKLFNKSEQTTEAATETAPSSNPLNSLLTKPKQAADTAASKTKQASKAADAATPSSNPLSGLLSKPKQVADKSKGKAEEAAGGAAAAAGAAAGAIALAIAQFDDFAHASSRPSSVLCQQQSTLNMRCTPLWCHIKRTFWDQPVCCLSCHFVSASICQAPFKRDTWPLQTRHLLVHVSKQQHCK